MEMLVSHKEKNFILLFSQGSKLFKNCHFPATLYKIGGLNGIRYRGKNS